MTECERLVAEGVIDSSFYEEEERCGFLVTRDRKKVWAIELDLLLRFDAVCRKHGLKYFLMDGSLLGVVRHKGFIPWDDDIDVGMMREDYDKLMRLGSEFCDPYFLQRPGCDSGYYYAFSKLRNTRTTCLVKNFRYRPFNHGVFIDIIPYDDWNVDGEAVFKEINSLCYKQSTWMRLNNPNLTEADKQRVLMYDGCDPDVTMRRIEKLIRRWHGDSTDLVAQVACAVIGYEHHVYKKQWLNGFEQGMFEGLKVPIPCGVNEYLKAVYGDYMKLPPIEKRGTWHDYYVFDPDRPYKQYLKEEYGIVL
ncbi:MAG: LicD family protein [Clostridia bacterium]|nr:LicD family protein [Clostridia bacterium]